MNNKTGQQQNYILLLISQYQISMYQHNTIDIEQQAKKTLAFFSDHDENKYEWYRDTETRNSNKRNNMRLLNPIKNVKTSKLDRTRNVNTSSFYRGRTPLVPSKIHLENQQVKPIKNQKLTPSNANNSNPYSYSYSRNPYMTMTKQNLRPSKTIRNAYSLSKQAQQKQQQQGFDFMQYWVRHRFEDGAINCLIQRLKEKNTSVLRM